MNHGYPLGWLVASIVLVVSWVPSRSSGQSGFELEPYRIRALVAFAPIPELNAHRIDFVHSELMVRTTSRLGAPWELEIEPASADLRSKLLGRIEIITLADVMAAVEDFSDLDKVILIGVSGSSTGYRVTARELDRVSSLWGVSIERMMSQPDHLIETIYHAIVNAFSPISQIGRPEGKKVDVRLRAGALAIDEKSPVLADQGTVLLPILRRNDRLGKAYQSGLKPVPWTYLLAGKREGSVLYCEIHSGMRNPLGGRSVGRRTLRLALVIRPEPKSSELRLRARIPRQTKVSKKQVAGQPGKMLAGYDIYARTPARLTAEKPDKTEKTEYVGRTDYRGVVMIPPGKQVLRILYVKNGGELLARLPMVPGLNDFEIAEVPDDDKRLEAEGYITGLQEKLVDLVVRRKLLAARVRQRIQSGKFDDAENLLGQFKMIERPAEFSYELQQKQQELASEDSRIQSKITILFEHTQTLLNQFLSDDEEAKLSSELEDARRSS